MPQLRNIISAASFRLTIAYASVFILGLLIIFVGGGTATVWFLESQLKQTVEDEIEELSSIYTAEGMHGAIEAIKKRSRADGDFELTYRLSTTANTVLAGSLDLPEFPDGWSKFVPPGKDDDEFHYVKTTKLTDTLRLSVAIDAESLEDAEDIIVNGAAWTLAIAVPLALICGALIASMVLRRIDAITTTTVHIREGGLSTRVPLRGTGDEFDRLATNINAMLDSIEALTKNIQDVSVGIAHDLRTPLSRVRNRLESIRGNRVASEEIKADVGRAIDGLSSVLGTFDALLRIAQIDSGTRRNAFRGVDISGLVGELVETYEPVASEAEKRLTASIDSTLEVVGDRDLLAQMIVNLMENTIEHTPAHTTIAITLSRDDGDVVLSIADDGPGIPEQERERVFERFYRLDRSRHANGNGLGLCLVSAVAKLHNAEVILTDNKPGLRVEICFHSQPARPHSKKQV
ncbi:MAG: HAMP domain-containing histidine kinase [Hyphomicrobiales bacterium]|nr:HAMP domain-containing histidine kinase [Hyphomicrobiales bacterium]